MKWTWRIWMPLGVFGVFVLAAAFDGVHAEVTSVGESPYSTFVHRNPFGLKPIPPPAPPPVVTSAPPARVNVQLSGISSFGGTKRAWLVLPPGPGRTNTTYLSFGEGDPEREGILVQSIDPARGMVQILNAGSPATLDFQNHGLAYSGPVAVNIPGQAQAAGARVVRPGTAATAGRPTAQPQQPGVIPAPGAQIAKPGATTATAPTAARTIPARNVRTATPPAPAPQIDPAVQAIQMRVNELRAQSEGRAYPPTPPIPGLP